MTETLGGREKPISSFETYIAELNELEPSQRRFALAIFLALKVVRVRMFKSTDQGLSAVAESLMPRNADIRDVCMKLSSAVDLPETSLSIVSSLSSFENGASIDIVVDESGNASLDLGEPLALEGEDLTTLQGKGMEPSTEFHASDARVDSFFSASEAARFLGVAKSTVTRKVDRNEVLGFRVFTNALRIPVEQFVDGSVVPGIPQVLAMFTEKPNDGERYTDHRGAWYFLNTTIFPGDSAPRPIDRLKASMRNRETHNVIKELSLVKNSLDHGDHI